MSIRQTRPTYLTTLMRFLTIAVILSSLVSCSPKLEDAVVGKWSMVGGTERMELLKDGTIIFYGHLGDSVSGKYTFVDRDRMRVVVGGHGVMATVAVSGDELFWTEPCGSVIQYKREK